MYMYVYVCVCMYNSEMGLTHKYKNQYMQVYSCICMYIHIHPLSCQRMGQKALPAGGFASYTKCVLIETIFNYCPTKSK